MSEEVLKALSDDMDSGRLEKLSMPGDEDLTVLSDMIMSKESLEKEVEDLEASLKEVKGRLKELDQNSIPDKLAEFNLSELRLLDGTRIFVEDVITASVTKANEPVVFEWLRGQGHEDIIKRDLVMKFTKGEDEQADAAAEVLKKNGLGYSDKEHIHWQTLRAFVKERLESGDAAFAEVQEKFGVWIGKKTKVVRP
jgi:hypothetical protein